jgi:hypothetical protein
VLSMDAMQWMDGFKSKTRNVVARCRMRLSSLSLSLSWMGGSGCGCWDVVVSWS